MDQASKVIRDRRNTGVLPSGHLTKMSVVQKAHTLPKGSLHFAASLSTGNKGQLSAFPREAPKTKGR